MRYKAVLDKRGAFFDEFVPKAQDIELKNKRRKKWKDYYSHPNQ